MGTPVYVANEDALSFTVQYYDHGDPGKRTELETRWQIFERFDPATKETFIIWSRPSNDAIELAVDRRLPPGTPAGRYRIETFVPGKHATTRKAIFSIADSVHQTVGGSTYTGETLAMVDMYDLYDVWYPLGEFELDPSLHPFLGRVRQYDVSREFPPTEVAFGPIRWMPITTLPNDRRRFDSPVGMPEERNGRFPTGRMMWGKYPVWAGEWFDANPFLSWYSYGAHTGADLNLPGVSATDQGKPIYAIGEGRVTYAGKAGTWGNIIVIEHPEGLVTYPDGHTEQQRVYSRYGHVDDHILVRTGEVIERGTNIGFIGLAAGFTTGWHLHFDISHTDLLKTHPAHWPNLDWMRSMGGASRNPDGYSRMQASVMEQVLSHYIDPLRFIQDNHPY